MTLPDTIDASILEARAHLAANLRVSTLSAASHQVASIAGWAENEATIRAVAIYMVGLIVSAIHRNLHVAASLDNRADDRAEISLNVERLVGTESEPLSASQKEDERNPWIAEGLWHLCLWLASTRHDLHPPGEVLALDRTHISAKDHGTDVVGIYLSDRDTFGVTFVECKAYKDNPSGAVVAAADFFQEVDAGTHDRRIRQVVADMRASLSQARQDAISKSLWKDVRCYIPNPHYDASNDVDWTNRRPKLAGLSVPAARIIIMPHAIEAFAEFFDDIGAAMVDFVATLPKP